MPKSWKALNEERKAGYYKDRNEEDFFLGMNKHLQRREIELYEVKEIDHPFIFIFGPPRSGTTLVSQLLAHSFDAGYINNLMARFWLAPLHGIRISKAVLEDEKHTQFQSDYARTGELADIHEFGYFWGYWLKKQTLEDISRAAEREKEIDWQGLRRTLANMQAEFGKPMVFKNIYGSYHLKKLRQSLGKVIFVYIHRDPLDTAVSILDARRKYYTDLNAWWSYAPVEYDLLKNLDYWEQIAGQVYFLQRYYRQQINECCPQIVVEVHYEDLCCAPQRILKAVSECSQANYEYELKVVKKPPETFPFRTYTERKEEKEKFKKLIAKFHEKYDD